MNFKTLAEYIQSKMLSSEEKDFSNEGYMQKLYTELKSPSGAIDPNKLESFIQKLRARTETSELDKEVKAMKAQRANFRRNLGHKTKPKPIPKHFILNTNCDSVCVKTKCYVLLMEFENPMSKKAQEQRWKCRQDCQDTCDNFRQHCLDCFHRELEGDCMFKQCRHDTTKLACHDKVKPCILKHILTDGLEKEENGIHVSINDKCAPVIDFGVHKGKWVDKKYL